MGRRRGGAGPQLHPRRPGGPEVYARRARARAHVIPVRARALEPALDGREPRRRLDVGRVVDARRAERRVRPRGVVRAQVEVFAPQLLARKLDARRRDALRERHRQLLAAQAHRLRVVVAVRRGRRGRGRGRVVAAAAGEAEPHLPGVLAAHAGRVEPRLRFGGRRAGGGAGSSGIGERARSRGATRERPHRERRARGLVERSKREREPRRAARARRACSRSPCRAWYSRVSFSAA